MKKLLSFILSGVVSAGAFAAELDLMPLYSADMSWSGASLASNIATWSEGWGGVVFNLENNDYSAYNFAVFNLEEPSHSKMKLEAYYSDEQSASGVTEADAGSQTIILRLDEAKRTNITKVAFIAAKPGSAIISKAALVDELEIDPVLFEGSVAVPDMKKIYFKLGAEKFVGLKKGQTLTIHFTTGDLQQYASVDLYSDNKKLKCQSTRTNTKKDGQFSLDATETSTVIADDEDVASLQTYGLQIKGRNVTITRVALTDGADIPDTPDNPDNPDNPDQPTEGVLWTGSVATGTWANDVTVGASGFAGCKDGDKLTIFLSVDAGNEYGNIELNDQKYTKLACDGSSAELDSYGCVQPTVSKLTYTLGSGDGALLSANGLRVKGANITVSRIELEKSQGGDTPSDETLWTGATNTGKWANDVTIEAPKFTGCKGGDIIEITLSVNDGNDYGNIELDDINYTKLACDGTSAQLDSYGCVQPDVHKLSYIITNADAHLIASNGLRIKGADITITEVRLLPGTALPDDPDVPGGDMTETQLWNGSVNCGQWVQTVTLPASAFTEAKAGDKLKINLSINAGKGKGIVKVQDGSGADLDMNGKGTNMDSSGNFTRGAKEAVYDITDGDLARLKSSGLIVSGFAVTVTRISLMSEKDADSITEIADDDDAPVEYYNICGQRVQNPSAGLYLRRQGNKVAKVYVK